MQQLSIQMKQDLETLQSRGASSPEQILSQQDALRQQINKLTDVARRHDDEIDDMRARQDFTHELVLEREQKENKHKMILKSWPQSAEYSDRVRVTDWLLYKAQVQDSAKQEQGYYSAKKKFTLSPVTILILTDTETHQRFESSHTQASLQNGHCSIGMHKATRYNTGKEDGTNLWSPRAKRIWSSIWASQQQCRSSRHTRTVARQAQRSSHTEQQTNKSMTWKPERSSQKPPMTKTEES